MSIGDQPRSDSQSHRSHLFTLRLWPEELDHARSEWRGQLRLVASGEVWYFRDWQALLVRLQAVLPGPTAEPDQPGERD